MISDKIGPHHLERKAILYVRQSSAHQAVSYTHLPQTFGRRVKGARKRRKKNL